MAPAPLKATACTIPERIASTRIGFKPHLIECAPIIRSTVRWLRTASAIASTIRPKSDAARKLGRCAMNSAKLAPAVCGVAKSATATLFGLSEIENVLILLQSSAGYFMGKREFANCRR